MKHWKDMFFITKMIRDNHDHWAGNFRKTAYFIINSATGEVIYGKYRKYPYSDRRDACRGAAQIFNHYMRSIEKDLLG